MKSKKVIRFADVSNCTLAEKRYVNRKAINLSKDYEDGDFDRAFCCKQSDWCDCEVDPIYCPYLIDFLK